MQNFVFSKILNYYSKRENLGKKPSHSSVKRHFKTKAPIHEIMSPRHNAFIHVYGKTGKIMNIHHKGSSSGN